MEPWKLDLTQNRILQISIVTYRAFCDASETLYCAVQEHCDQARLPPAESLWSPQGKPAYSRCKKKLYKEADSHSRAATIFFVFPLASLLPHALPPSYPDISTDYYNIEHYTLQHQKQTMTDSDHSCRICRGEATAEQPLMHPCKCRGLIKYIHQDCLMEWLHHSNKSAKQCDICNTPYKFRTIYDPNMPSRLPFREILGKLLLSVSLATVKYLSIMLYGLCAIHVPLFWKFVGRVFTYALDGKLPLPELRISHMLLYGAYTTRAPSGVLLAGPDATFWDKFETFLANTLASGVLDVLASVLVLFVVFVEHEWVVREEGYTKSLLREIGKEPRTKLADLLSLMVQQGNNEEAREQMINRALEDIQHLPEYHRHEAMLRRALNQGQHNDLLLGERGQNGTEPGEVQNEHPTQDGVNVQAANNGDVENAANDNFHEIHGFHRGEAHENPHEQESGESGEVHDLFPVVNPTVDWPEHDDTDAPYVPSENDETEEDEDDEDDDEEFTDDERPAVDLNDGNESDNEPEELERRRNLAEDELAAAEAADNADIMDLLGIRFNLVTPLQLAVIADFIVLMFLFFVYLVPHFVGNMAAMVASAVCIGTYKLAVQPLLGVLPLTSLPLAAVVHEKVPLLVPVFDFCKDVLVKPAVQLLQNLGSFERTQPPSFVERVILLSIGYSFACGGVYLMMRTLTAGKKPIVGTPRRVYKALFQVAITAKVFAIFAIEIVIFPLFCGWILDFCAIPLIEKNLLWPTEPGISYYLFKTSVDYTPVAHYRWIIFGLWEAYLRPITLWGFGTCYMFLIAMFVGMVRNNVLRPGVLFFIKSPEDPNARLIHDAIVKPFFLQALRIFLSAKVYTAFILLGIGSVTWGLRFFVNPPGASGKDSTLLPIGFSGGMMYVLPAVLIGLFRKSRHIAARHSQKFWRRVFEAVCYKLRLSHFILGHPVAQERGSIVYRNFVYGMLAMGVPDYTRPVSYNEAMEIFRNDPDVLACFVPDGAYVRAPATDDNSRKFLRGLFVPVTKSDVLINPAPEAADDDDTDWWDADIQYDDTYTVVYQPPNLKARCIALVCMICAIGALAVVVLGLIAVVLGRPVRRAATIFHDFLFVYTDLRGPLPSEQGNWMFVHSTDLLCGLIIMTAIMALIENRGDAISNGEFVVERARVVQWVRARKEAVKNSFIDSLLKLPQIVVFTAIHLHYVSFFERYYFGCESFVLVDGEGDFQRQWLTLLHVLVLPSSLAIVPNWDKKRLWRAWTMFLMILTHMLFEKKSDLSQTTDYALHAVVLGLILLYDLVTWLLHFESTISEQIKNEKYVTGSAVENLDSED